MFGCMQAAGRVEREIGVNKDDDASESSLVLSLLVSLVSADL